MARAVNRTVAIDVRGVSVTYDDLVALDGVDLAIEPGAMVSLLGPSGCGKTTLLRALAGLEPVVAGEIRLGDEVVSSASRLVPPERRRVGLVFQDWALFPHMSVRRNVAYGLRRSDRESPRVDEVLEMVGLAGYDDRQPHTLSGGQQQRVALARALAPQPSVLLLDEPFSNLDSALRVEVRSEVHRLLNDLDVTAVFVTHDQDEAFVLGDSVAVMLAGRIVQFGSPAEIYAAPATPWVAGFVGEANLVPSHAANRSATTALGSVPLRVPAEGEVFVLLRPEDLSLSEGGSGRVQLVEYYGHDTEYEVVLPDGEVLRARLSSTPQFRRGDAVTVRFVGGPVAAYDNR